MKKLLLLVLIILSFPACATVQYAPEAQNVSAKKFITREGRASVYVFRRSLFYFGGAVSFLVKLDGKDIGYLRPGTFYLLPVTPGQHIIVASSHENSSESSIATVSGQCYFLETIPVPGIIAARVSMGRVDKKEGKKNIQDCNLVEFKGN